MDPASSRRASACTFRVLGERGPSASQALVKQQRVLVDEAERNEFGETSGLVLNLAQQEHLPHPVLWGFGVTVHYCGSGADAVAVRGANHFLDPLRGGELVG